VYIIKNENKTVEDLREDLYELGDLTDKLDLEINDDQEQMKMLVEIVQQLINNFLTVTWLYQAKIDN